MQTIIYTGKKPTIELSETFRNTIEDLINEDNKVVYIDADLMGSMKTKEIWKNYPNRIINTGIQEANMVGLAAGLYLSGMKPYIHSFSPFVTRRVYDQLFVSVGYANKSVRVIGSDAGIMASYNGGTHMCFEDISLMRAIPDACVIDVSDSQMFKYFLKSTKDRKGLTYFRTARRDVADIYPENTEFQEGKGKIIEEGDFSTIIASGIMVTTAIEASKILKSEGINVRVIDIITIKPIDRKLIVDSAMKTKCLVTAENHNIYGGLGSAVSEIVSEECPVPVIKVGIKDRYGQVGSESYLRKEYNLTEEDIVLAVKKAHELKNKLYKV